VRRLKIKGNVQLRDQLLLLCVVTVCCLQPFSFPVETTFDDMKDKCLHHAINCDTHPLLQVTNDVLSNRNENVSSDKVRALLTTTITEAKTPLKMIC